MLKAFGQFPEIWGKESRSKESEDQLFGQVFEPHAGLSFRQYASRNIRQWSTEYIGWLQVVLGRSTSLLLCLLVASKHRWCRLVHRRRSKKFGICDVQGSPRNENLQPVRSEQQRVVYHRTAVGLAPLGCTNNGW